MLGFTIQILLGLDFETAIALLTPKEVIVLATGAHPTTVGEIKVICLLKAVLFALSGGARALDCANRLGFNLDSVDFDGRVFLTNRDRLAFDGSWQEFKLWVQSCNFGGCLESRNGFMWFTRRFSGGESLMLIQNVNKVTADQELTARFKPLKINKVSHLLVFSIGYVFEELLLL